MPDPDENQSATRLSPDQALALSADQRLARAEPAPPLNLQAITERILTGEITNEKLAMIKDLVAMDAERQFARAFTALQAETPRIQPTRPVPDKQGVVKFKFAAFEDIMTQVAPLLQKHGFTVSFSNRYEGDRIIETCTLQHIGGHKRSNDFAVRVGSGPPGASSAQADGAAATYAKRFALTNALNIIVSGMDSDARLEGANITPEQAAELERRVKETASDRKAFLKFAGANSFDTIAAEKYAMLDQNLRRKERTN